MKVAIMVVKKLEWRSYIKISKLKGLTLSQIYPDLKSVFGAELPTYDTILRWFNRFEGEDGTVQDAFRSGRPRTGKSDRNMHKVDELIKKNRRITVREVARNIKLSYGTAYRIITASLGLVIRCARWVSKIFKIGRASCRVRV